MVHWCIAMWHCYISTLLHWDCVSDLTQIELNTALHSSALWCTCYSDLPWHQTPYFWSKNTKIQIDKTTQIQTCFLTPHWANGICAHLALQYCLALVGVSCEIGDNSKEVVLQKGRKDSFAKLVKMYFVILPLMPFVNNLRIYSRKQTLEQESARCRNNSFQTLEQTLRANKLQLKNFIFCQFLVLQISFQI